MSYEFDGKRRRFIRLGIFIGVGLSTAPELFADEITDLIAPDTHNEIIAVRLWPSAVYTRLTIESVNSIDAACKVVNNPLAVIIDINNVQLNSIVNGLSARVLAVDPIIRDIKVVQLDAGTLRIFIYLKKHIQVQTQVIAPVDLGSVHYQYRYVADMYPATGDNDDKGLSDEILAFLELNSDGNSNAVQVPDSQKIVVPNPKAGIASFTIPEPTNQPQIRPMPEIAQNGRKLIVMLDPGHGGEDPGAIGPSGLKEKDVVLDIGKRLQTVINQSGYIKALMTRNQDMFIPLSTRVAIARSAKADIFVSIHADAFTNPLAHGSSVFILSDHGASSSFARWVAKTQNQADLIGGMTFNTRDKSISRLLLDMTQTWTMNSSNRLGRILLGQMGTINQLHTKSVEKAGFAVLKAPDIPSALVETAFISNPGEEKKLKEAAFRQKIADNLAYAISNFAQTIRKS